MPRVIPDDTKKELTKYIADEIADLMLEVIEHNGGSIETADSLILQRLQG